LIFDESALELAVQTEVIKGGIGFNFTTLRMSCFHSDESDVRIAKVTIVIYGLPYS